MKRIILFLFFSSTIFTLSAQPIRLATYQYADNNRIKNIQPLAEQLNTKYGFEVIVKNYPTVHAFINAIRNNEVDIALINTFGYLLLEASGNAYPMHPVTALELRADAKDNYKTAILASPTVKAKSLTDLAKEAAGLKLALVSIGSTSGNLVPRLALAGAGIPEPEKVFAEVHYSNTHAAAVDDVLKGNAQIAAMGHTEYEKNIAQDSRNGELLKLIWLSPEIPLGPVLFNNGLTGSLQETVLNELLNLHKDNPNTLESIKAGWSEAKQASHFVPINANHYDAFKQVLGNRSDLTRILKQFAQ